MFKPVLRCIGANSVARSVCVCVCVCARIGVLVVYPCDCVSAAIDDRSASGNRCMSARAVYRCVGRVGVLVHGRCTGALARKNLTDLIVCAACVCYAAAILMIHGNRTVRHS